MNRSDLKLAAVEYVDGRKVVLILSCCTEQLHQRLREMAMYIYYLKEMLLDNTEVITVFWKH